MSDVDALSSPGDVAEIISHAFEPGLCPADLRLLLEVTSLVRAHGDLLDALAALRGKMRRELELREARAAVAAAALPVPDVALPAGS